MAKKIAKSKRGDDMAKVPVDHDEEMASRQPMNNIFSKGESAMVDEKDKTKQHTHTTTAEPPAHHSHQSSKVSAHQGDPESDAAPEGLASTNMILDATTLAGMTPTAASLANAINANGPIMDIPGNCGLVLNHFKEAQQLLKYVSLATDAADPNKTKITGVSSALTGGGTPSSTVITDMTTVVNTPPTAASSVLACSPNGPIVDLVGNENGVNIMFKEAKNILTLLGRVLDAADPMKAAAANLASGLV